MINMENLSNDIKTIINTAYPYIKEFNPAQKAVIESGYLEDKSNYIISIPTASGKTVLGILPALKTILMVEKQFMQHHFFQFKMKK